MTSKCDLGNHNVGLWDKKLQWCCPDCLEIFRKNHNEIVRQGELERERKDRLNPYRFIPYYAVTLAFIGFLITFFA